MIAGAQPKILLKQDENNNLVMNGDFQQLFNVGKMNWKLIRERDGLTKLSKAIIWVEWDINTNKFLRKSNEIAINLSLIMSPFNNFYTWQTTIVTKIIEHKEDYIKFETENSVYELFKL